MIRLRTLIFAAGLSVACAAPAWSQSAPIRQGVTTQDLSGQVQQLQQTNAEMRLQMNNLQQEVAELTGKVQTLEFLLGQTRDEINRQQGDDAEIGRILGEINQELSTLDRRIASLDERIANIGTQSAGISPDAGVDASDIEATGDPASRTVVIRNADGSVTTRTVTAIEPAGEDGQGGPMVVTGATSTDAAPVQTGALGTISAADLPGEAGPLFMEAKSRLLQFDYAGAETAFSAFLESFGDDPQAGEAMYWLGEVLYQQDAYVRSGQAYTEMISTFPDDPRAPDALVKLARSMRLIGEAERACAALEALPLRYPDASSVTKNFAAVEGTRSGC